MRIRAALILALTLLSLLPYAPVSGAQESDFTKILEIAINANELSSSTFYATASLFTVNDGGSHRPYLVLSSPIVQDTVPYTRIYSVDTGKQVEAYQRASAYDAINRGDSIVLVGTRSIHVLYTDRMDLVNRFYYTVYYNELPNGTTYLSVADIQSGNMRNTVYVYGEGSYYYTIVYPDDDVSSMCGGNPYISWGSIAALSNDTVLRGIRLRTDNYPAAFLAEDRRAGLVSCIVHDFGSSSENFRAITGFTASRSGIVSMWADGLYPYLAGLDGVDEVYVYKHGWSSIKVVRNPGFVKDMGFAQLRLAMDSGGRIHLVILDRDGDTPRLVFLDPDTLSVVKVLRLDGYTAKYPAIDVGYYYGAPALYVGVDGYVVIVSLDSMEAVHALDVSPIDSVMRVNYDRGPSGDVLLVRGVDNGGGLIVTQVYSHLGVKKGTIITLEVDKERVEVGSSIQATVKLTTTTGTPLQGRLVEIQKLVRGEWATIATGITGQDGAAVVTIGITERGPWVLRAVYGGDRDEAASWSSSRTVVAIERVKVTVKTPRTWLESLPIPVEVKVASTATGAPVGGVWVAVYANLSGAKAQVGAAPTSSDGRAVASIRLPSGVYSVTAGVIDPYIVIGTLEGARITVRPPTAPVPEGPYLAPVGRVVSSSPVVAEAGAPATVLFTLYYGEALVNATSVSARVEGLGPASVRQASTGVYLVDFTPPRPGVYLVVLEASYGSARYIGTAEVLAVNLAGKVAEWDAMVRGAVEDLQNLSTLLLEYLDSINASLQALNVTRLVGLLTEVKGDTALLLDYGAAINSSLAQALASLGEVAAITAGNREMLMLLNSNVEEALGLLNASLAGISSGLAQINTSIGVIAASVSAIATSVEEIGDSMFRIETRLGNITLDLAQLAAALDEGREATLKVLGLIDSLQGVVIEVRDNTATILTSTGEVKEVVLSQLQPKVLEVGDKIALVDSKLGLLAAKADEIAGLTSKAGEDIGRAMEKIDQLAVKLDQVSGKLDEMKQASAQDMIARGVGGVALLLGVIALAASRRRS